MSGQIEEQLRYGWGIRCVRAYVAKYAARFLDDPLRCKVILVADDAYPGEAGLICDRQQKPQGLRRISPPLFPGNNGVAHMTRHM